MVALARSVKSAQLSCLSPSVNTERPTEFRERYERVSAHKTIITSTFLTIVLASFIFTACAAPSASITYKQPSSALAAASTPAPFDALGPESSNQPAGARGGEVAPHGSDYATPTQEPALPPAPAQTPMPAPAALLQPAQPAFPTVGPTEAPLEPVTVYQNYTVRLGDTLTDISQRTGVPMTAIMQLNSLQNPDRLNAGQVLHLSATIQVGRASGATIIPDSEAVYSPAYANFDVNAFAQQYHGYLMRYSENVEGMNLTGPQIVQLVSERFSVGPRVLLTILEMQGGWVTGNPKNNGALNYPMGYLNASWSGLYRQLWFAADKLNEGYYGKVYHTLNTLTLLDGTRLNFSSQVNPGTAALQDLMAYESGYNNWKYLVGPSGFSSTYRKLFGDPFAHAIDPLVPVGLMQPNFRLPWEDGHTWFYVGGPHGGWADGSAWAAVDFAPYLNHGTCTPSPEWSVAVAPGRIVQAENGRVMENLQGTNFQGNGWTIMYMHQGAAGRVAIGALVQTGDHIGHPSCEGGAAQADHLHIARLYNGQWIAAADPNIPFVLGGWRIVVGSSEYDGGLAHGNSYVGACNCTDFNLNGILAPAGQNGSH
jgi:LasA protease